MENEEETSIIYGLDSLARALTSQCSDTEKARFFVGTQSLKSGNSIHVLEYDEYSNTVSKVIHPFEEGEIWSLQSSSVDPELLSVVFNHIQGSNSSLEAGIYRVPASDVIPAQITDGSCAAEMIAKFPTGTIGKNVRAVRWHPSSGSEVVTAVDGSLAVWSLATSSPAAKVQLTVDPTPDTNITACEWNPHQQCSQIATAVKNSVQSWDVRSMKAAWSIEEAHRKVVRCIDFNPNKQYCLVTGGNDGLLKYWDTRNTTQPLLVQSAHSHWVWGVKYNTYHDQLVLSCGSDSKVILSSALSVSSELNDNNGSDSENEQKQESSPRPDKVIQVYEEHEDSVYSIAWSPADPWIFGSLSYDGRVVLGHVPRSLKYEILL